MPRPVGHVTNKIKSLHRISLGRHGVSDVTHIHAARSVLLPIHKNVDYKKKIFFIYRNFGCGTKFGVDDKDRAECIEELELFAEILGDEKKPRKGGVTHNLSVAQIMKPVNEESQEERAYEYFTIRGSIFFNDGNYLDAMKEFEMARHYDSLAWEPCSNLALIHEILGRHEEATFYSEEALHKGQRGSHGKCMNTDEIANEYFRLGRLKELVGDCMSAHLFYRESLYYNTNSCVIDALSLLEKKYFKLEYTREKNFERIPLPLGSGDGGGIVEVRETKRCGLGLFATRDVFAGDVLWYEVPLSVAPDINSRVEDTCRYCLRSMYEPEFVFSNEESDKEMRNFPAEFEGLKSEILSRLDIPVVKKVWDKDGFCYCNDYCRSQAELSGLGVIGRLLPKDHPDHALLFPSQHIDHLQIDEYAKKNRSLMLKDFFVIEILTLLVANFEVIPETRFYVERLAGWERMPCPFLTRNERLQLDVLRRLFPRYMDDWLTERGFLKLKSVVEANAFMTRMNRLVIVMDGSMDGDGMALQIKTKEGECGIAQSLFGLSSFMNHSCDPNVMELQNSINKSISWIAMKSIRAGEELFKDYFNCNIENLSSIPRTDRRKLIHDVHNFWCFCPLCQQQQFDTCQ